MISVRPIISTFTGPIFTKFAGLIGLWLKMNDPKLFFDRSRDVDVATNCVSQIQTTELGSRAICQRAAGVRQEVQVLR